MAIYKEIKKRMNADGSKALVASAFPGELQSQIVSDFRVAVSEYVAQQRTRSEAKAAAVARAKAAKPTLRSRASWFFKASSSSSSVDLVDKKEEKEGEQVEQEQEQDPESPTTFDPPPRRPGTPTPPPAPSPVALPLTQSQSQSQSQVAPKKTLLSRLSFIGVPAAYPTSTSTASQSTPATATQQQSTSTSNNELARKPSIVKFDLKQANAEAAAAFLLLWAIVDALKKAAIARKAIDDAKLNPVQEQEEPIDLVDEANLPTVTSYPTAMSTTPLPDDPSTASTTDDEDDADAVIGKTEREREHQLLSTLNNESLISLIRAIQACLSILKQRFALAGVNVVYDEYPSPESSIQSPPQPPSVESLEIVEEEVDSSSPASNSKANSSSSPSTSSSTATSTTTSTTSTKPTPKNKKYPPLVHPLSQYPSQLVNKLKLGWGQMVMILEAETKEEIVELLDRMQSVWQVQEQEVGEMEDSLNGVSDGNKDVIKQSTPPRLFLLDVIIEILKERGNVLAEEIEWL
ncbi:hypothetical protein HDU79_008451 [Rhizoclosmatium sp. JEL0117]|nr:hypothetical protein HDU79_008451 [Rhizoclosmatium sp. JEL0117]